MSIPLRLVLGVTGASGSVIARRLLRLACGSDRVGELHLAFSDAARRVAHDELGTKATSAVELADEWLEGIDRRADLVVHAVRDIGASLASGSFPHDGMIVAPCSTATLGAIAGGVSANLVHRAAECTLKEQRKLILMVRETPLSAIQLENMLRVARAGAVVMPICPPWYHHPRTLDDLVDDTCARALDHLGLPDIVARRWDGSGGDARR